MKYAVCVILLSAMAASLSCAAEADVLEATASPNGTLSLDKGSRHLTDFVIGLFDEKWQSVNAVASPSKNFSLKTPGGILIPATATFSRNADGALAAKYTFAPATDVTLNSLYTSADFKVGALAGTAWLMDAESGTFPAERKETSLRVAKVKTLKLAPKNSPELTLIFRRADDRSASRQPRMEHADVLRPHGSQRKIREGRGGRFRVYTCCGWRHQTCSR